MHTSKSDQLVRNYLHRVKVALENATPSQRDEIMDGLAQHIAEARSHLTSGNEAELETLLDHLGSPEEIAESLGVRPRYSKLDPWVPWILLLGGFVFWAGWIVGVVLLWSSGTWRLKDKLLGTFIWPGGLVLPVLSLGLVGGTSSGQGNSSSVHNSVPGVLPQPLGVIITIVVFLSPILVAVYLHHVRRRRQVA